MKKILLLFVFGAFLSNLKAQEQAIYSQYVFYPVLINPGATGFDGENQFIFNLRNNWSGFPGAPKTYNIMYNGSLNDKLGIGGGILSEKIGSQNYMRASLNYSFQFKVNAMKMGLGMSAEFSNRTIDAAILDHPAVQTGDDALEDLVNGRKVFGASVGAYTTYDDRFFVALSLPGAIRARLDEAPIEDNADQSSLLNYYFFQIGYIFQVPDQDIKLVPSMALRKIRNVPYQVDFNLKGMFLDEKLIAGLTFRPSAGGATAFHLGTKFNQAELYYTYDLSFQRFQQYNAGAHEIGVAFNFAKKQAKRNTSLPSN